MKYFYTILILVSFIGARPKTLFTIFHVGTPGVYLDLQNFKSGLGVNDGDVVIINTGTYPGGIFTNSRFGTTGITVRASDTGVIFNSTVDFNNVKSITFDKLQFRNISGRGAHLVQPCDTVTFSNSNWYNINDYMIYLDGTGTTYLGTAATRFNNLSFIRDTFRVNGPGVNVMSTNGSGAVCYRLTVQYCRFDSTFGTTASCISLTNNQRYALIDNNYFSNINLDGTSHNSVIYFQGAGTISNNLCINRQGNFVRARAYSVDSGAAGNTIFPDTLYMFNNRDCSARKYAQFEEQHKSGDTSTNTTLPNTRTGIFFAANNTCLNTRTSDYTPFGNSTGGGAGQFDIYDWYPNRAPINKDNICARAYIDSVPNPASPPAGYTFNYQFHNGGGSKPVGQPVFGDTSNNLYIQVASNLSGNWGGRDSLVMNLVSNSPARGYGTNTLLYKVPIGYRGNARKANQVDAGADQFNTWQLGPVPYHAVKKVP